MMGALVVTLALGSGVGEPPPPAPEPDMFTIPSSLDDVKTRVKKRMPGIVGWVGIAGMGVSALVAVVGAGLVAAAAAQVMAGRAAQESYDAADGDNSVESTRTRRSYLAASRDAFNVSQVLAGIGSAVLVTSLVISLGGALVLIVDETILRPALKAREVSWAITGPAVGYREPTEGLLPTPLPSVPGVTTPPEDTPKPPPSDEKPHG